MNPKGENQQFIKNYLHSFSVGSSDKLGDSLEAATTHFFQSQVIGIGMHQFAYILNMNTQVIEHVSGVQSVLGYGVDEFDIIKYHEMIHPSDIEKMMQATVEATTHVVENRETTPLAAQLSVTYRIQHKKGHYVHLQDSISILSVDEEGMPIKGICICSNISQIPFTEVTADLSCPCNQLNTFACLEKKEVEFNFTKRESEIMVLIGQGKSSEEIGKQLYISKHTVDKHRSNILHKAGVKRTQDLFNFFSHSTPH